MQDKERARALGLSTGPPDDTAFYEIYLDDQGASEGALDALQKECLHFAEELTLGYIWQKDSFNLQQSAQSPQPWLDGERSSRRACLWGQTSFGDNLDDEWLIVFLLMRLTSTNKLTSARIWDTDGEFLLIEAAYALPQWLRPESSAERVWIRGGVLHLVPLQSVEHPTLPLSPTTEEALQMLQSQLPTQASSRIQAAIAARLSAFPSQILGSMHRAAAVLPEKLAAVLQQQPHLVAPAVLAFHYKEPSDLRIAHKMVHFPAEEVLVNTVVKFSRCLYAQLVTQHYDPPPSFDVPLPSDPGFPALILGAKLTAGFEMLVAKASADASQGKGKPGSLQDVKSSLAWPPYMQKLADEGFFGEERIGSRRHDELLWAAAEQFRQTAAYKDHRLVERGPAEEILGLLRSHSCTFDPSKIEGHPESDKWMSEGMEEIEKQLKQRQEEKDGKEGEAPSADPAELVERFKEFLSGEADLDGADLGEQGPRAGSRGDSDTVDLDEDNFWKEMKQILRLQELDGADAADGLSGSEGSSFYGDYPDDDSSEGDSRTMSTRHVRPRKSAPATAAADSTAPSTFTRPRRTADDRFSSDAGSMSTRKKGSESSAFQASRKDKRDLPSTSDRVQNEEDSEVETATDSDDEADYFDAAYDEALKAQMQDASVQFPGGHLPTAEDDEQPLDLDMNLVQNLLASYEAQEGFPGPVSNLFGMMGLHLPTERGDASGK